ncbi:hypothetical protein FHW12_000344 [Dokdonella fugitiva]|uniref:Uncharacterized protein n=1 Tax=Dokdonella fugitiva TaxID=328517 RepID=A0A839EU68_9GAMM|nr:hypothetical protein [Dokdonella fugitiva]MBA8886153.1 hypothetical protein [Dokdonella fugitiva]
MFPLKNSNYSAGEASFYLREGQDVDAQWQGQSVVKIPAKQVDTIMRSGDDAEIEGLADSLLAAFPEKHYVDRDLLAMWLAVWRNTNYR